MSRLAGLIEERALALLAEWSADEQRARPLGILAEMAAALRSGTVPEHSPGARAYGRQRHLDGVPVSSLVAEYRELRTAFVEVVSAVLLPAPSDLRILLDFLSMAIAESVTAHAEEQQVELRTFRSLVDASPDLVGISDLDGHVRYMNPAGRKLVGAGTLEEARARLVIDFFTPETAEKTAAAMFPPVLRGGAFHGETAFRHFGTGESIPMLQDTFAILDDNGKRVAAATIARDLRRQKRLDDDQRAILRHAQATREEAQTDRDRQRAIFLQSPVAIAIFEGPEHVFTFTNPAYDALIDGRDVLGKPLYDALPDVRGQGFDRIIAQVMQTGEVLKIGELPMKLGRHRSDERIVLSVVYTPKRGATGAIDGVIFTGVDVTDHVASRLRVEALAQRVKQSEDRLHRVVESSGVGLWDLDIATGTVEADARYRVLQNMPAAGPLTLAKALGGVHVEDAERMTRTVNEAIAGANRGVFATEFRAAQSPDVPPRWLEVRGQVAESKDGALHLAGALLDVTARKTAELESARARTRMEEVLDSMADAFFALDEDFRFTMVNRSFERISQQTREVVVGRSIWDVFPDTATPASEIWRSYHRCMRERVPVRFFDRYEPLALEIDVRVYPTTDAGIAVFFRDVASERRAESVIKRQTDLEQQLIGIVSHDLRNPLSVISMGTGALLEDALDEATEKLVRRMQSSAERATRLVNDLLDFSQARLGGGIAVHRRPVDLQVLVRVLVEELEVAHPGRFSLVVEGDARGDWDADRLTQIALNLLTNALKYGAPDEPIEVVVRGGDDHVLLCVHNEGPPIESDKLDSLFQPFQRATKTPDGTSRSVGLGLYIVTELAQAHRGTVQVVSTAAEGTTFTVTLPRRSS